MLHLASCSPSQSFFLFFFLLSLIPCRFFPPSVFVRMFSEKIRSASRNKWREAHRNWSCSRRRSELLSLWDLLVRRTKKGFPFSMPGSWNRTRFSESPEARTANPRISMNLRIGKILFSICCIEFDGETMESIK